MRRALCLLGVAALVACGDSTVKTPPPAVTPDAGAAADAGSDVLRVATFNVKRFFDDVCDGTCTAGSFEVKKTTIDFKNDAKRIATGIQKLGADVVSLQEIENEKAFEALKTELAVAGITYPIAVLGESGAPGSLDVALLAKGTLLETRTHRKAPIKRPDGTSTTFTRELLEVRLKTPSEATVIVFATHFRSKADDDPGRRLAEAGTARDIALAAQKEAPTALVLLAGDLNDVPGSDTLAALEQGGFVRVAKDLPQAEQTTFTFQGTPQFIDHIYATPESAPRFRAGSAAVVRDDASGFAGSDHAALRAEFDLAPR